MRRDTLPNAVTQMKTCASIAKAARSHTKLPRKDNEPETKQVCVPALKLPFISPCGRTAIREAMTTPFLTEPIKRTDVPDERILEVWSSVYWTKVVFIDHVKVFNWSVWNEMVKVLFVTC